MFEPFQARQADGFGRLVMAFSTTTDGQDGVRIRTGTYTNTAGSTGGTIPTGFAKLYGLFLMPTSHWNSATPKVTPTDGDSDVTIVTEADVDGRWVAIGAGEAS